jgi:hypothetical protein
MSCSTRYSIANPIHKFLSRGPIWRSIGNKRVWERYRGRVRESEIEMGPVKGKSLSERMRGRAGDEKTWDR